MVTGLGLVRDRDGEGDDLALARGHRHLVGDVDPGAGLGGFLVRCEHVEAAGGGGEPVGRRQAEGLLAVAERSEERRVGKEWRWGWGRERREQRERKT